MSSQEERERSITIREFFTSYECDGPNCNNFYVTGTREHRADGEEGNTFSGPHAADPTAEGWIAIAREVLGRSSSGYLIYCNKQFCSEACEMAWKVEATR